MKARNTYNNNNNNNNNSNNNNNNYNINIFVGIFIRSIISQDYRYFQYHYHYQCCYHHNYYYLQLSILSLLLFPSHTQRKMNCPYCQIILLRDFARNLPLLFCNVLHSYTHPIIFAYTFTFISVIYLLYIIIYNILLY